MKLYGTQVGHPLHPRVRLPDSTVEGGDCVCSCHRHGRGELTLLFHCVLESRGHSLLPEFYHLWLVQQVGKAVWEGAQGRNSGGCRLQRGAPAERCKCVASPGLVTLCEAKVCIAPAQILSSYLLSITVLWEELGVKSVTPGLHCCELPASQRQTVAWGAGDSAVLSAPGEPELWLCVCPCAGCEGESAGETRSCSLQGKALLTGGSPCPTGWC